MRSIIHQWDTSSAYTYGYLIAPISVYLIWQERHALQPFVIRPQASGLVVIVAFAVLWTVADITDINIGRHLALVGMMQGLCLTVLGWPHYKKMAFPLNYLWLMVPAGEALLYPLQVIAHSGSVSLLQLSGIPVFAEDLLIQVPQGNFLVEPGCAGLNFVLAGFALALVYGRVMYRSTAATVVCVVIAVTAAVVANVGRIFLIIALTEWTDRRIGLADDHLLFGWGVFAVVMLALMWMGLRYAKPTMPASQTKLSPEPPQLLIRCAIAMVAAVGIAASMQMLRHTIDEAAVLRAVAPYVPQAILPPSDDTAIRGN